MVAERSLVALPTYYSGVRFKSSLEARWAMYFDLIDIEWFYEDEAYRLPSGPYLPDFWLPVAGIHAEVKPETGFSLTELVKCKELGTQTDTSVLLLDGPPRPTVFYLLLAHPFDLKRSIHVHVPGKADPMEYVFTRFGDAQGGYFECCDLSTGERHPYTSGGELIRVHIEKRRLQEGTGWWTENWHPKIPYGNKWTEFRRLDRDHWNETFEDWEYKAVRTARRTRTGELVRA